MPFGELLKGIFVLRHVTSCKKVMKNPPPPKKNKGLMGEIWRGQYAVERARLGYCFIVLRLISDYGYITAPL